MGISKLLRLGLLQLCKFITSYANLRLGWSLNQSYSPCRNLSNGMSHATCMQGNWVDSWLSMVGNQTVNLTPNLSFGHNLCCKCPNGSCEPILDICASIVFQWYKRIFKAMGFSLCNRFLKFWKSIGTPTPNMGVQLGSVRVHSHILPHSRVSLLARTLVNPCLGHKSKAKVATNIL